MFCKNCGAEIKKGSKFCGKCGAPVLGATQTLSPQSNVRKKTNVIVIALIAIIGLSLLIGAIAIVKSIITKDTGSSNSYYSASDNDYSDYSESDRDDEIPAYDEAENFCYEGLTWDMSYDEVYEKLDEMFEETPSNGIVSNREGQTFVLVNIHNYDGMEGINADFYASFINEQMYRVEEKFNFEENCEYSLEDLFERLVNKYKDIFGVGKAADIGATKEYYWVYYDSSYNKVGDIMIQLADYNNNVWLAHSLDMDVR